MFELTEDQLAIRDMVRDFAAEALAPNAAKWDETKHFPVDVLAQAGELGMGGIYAAEEYGGSGLSRSDAVLIFEELSAADPSIAAYISIHNMVVWMIDSFGTADQRARWVPELASMTALGSYCLTEPGAGSDAAALTTKAERDGGEYVLNGVKQFISGAGASKYYIVMARTSGTGARGISAFVVPADTPGLSFGPAERKMGWNAQPTGQVIFTDLRIPAGNLLGAEGDGFGIAMKGLNGGRINMGACSLGGAQSALDKTVAHLKQRTAFGKPLIEQTSLLFRLADMEMDLQTARTMLWRAAQALDRGAPDVVKLCAIAKRVATDNAFRVANEALQLHGGYGYLSEYGLEKIVRDLRVHQILEGSNEIMQLIVGRNLAEAGA
ncbi:acyl-CoA dehydrogenase family protein [Arthrobacter sp. zg-ZUI100]|uniref:Acyl-CoA dehydrogenase family protein n=1 Tax=Arthrobacter jiangjiafuii TaxID=2817475 RepID=A0A975M3E5_9MICC|nr:acyl-CoA dehydrogenase family protein [Arthrobacter jiangjiafuii]MBP3036211.1 acyl-CoA dehydrogenase family protein [Arthrobacter jiangjiafuii]MBP3043286.1 acyl-CoA dehydrogenase family protein [Arthrobacter jiangjiafuii]QWC08829.1 acyl-CoA dehydrogenase family protein [Arthrobacter jiangjiafuii]